MRNKPGQVEAMIIDYLETHGEFSVSIGKQYASVNSIKKPLRKFKEEGRIYIKRWDRAGVNRAKVPVYALGNLPDAKKPRNRTPEEVRLGDIAATRKYQKKNKEKIAERRRKWPKGSVRGYAKPKLIELFKSGEEMTTFKASELTLSHKSNVQRIIKALRKNLFISDWEWRKDRYIAVWAWKTNKQPDMPKPTVSSKAIIVKQWGWLYGSARV